MTKLKCQMKSKIQMPKYRYDKTGEHEIMAKVCMCLGMIQIR
jgi:hypothetical protein